MNGSALKNGFRPGWRNKGSSVLDHQMMADLYTVEMLQSILSTGRVILIHLADDGFYSGSAGTKHAVAETLESFVEELTDHPRKKICLKRECISAGQPMMLSRFAVDPDSLDGRATVCKSCESRRVLEFKRKKKLQLSTGKQDQPGETLPNVEGVIDP